jgi:hypothetical protein
MQWQTLLTGQISQRISRLALFFRGATYRHHILAILKQAFQNSLAKGLLSVQYDAH